MTKRQARARASPLGFATVAIPKYKPFGHLKKLDLLLIEAFEEQRQVLADESQGGRFDRLIVTMPPRHGKSETISKATPAWFMGMHPDLSIILASYEARFAARWGAKARDLLAEHGQELLGVHVDRKQAANEWKVTGGQGVMVTAGAGGAITGKGGELMIIDDPIKNAEEAQSEVIRENHWAWWQSTVLTRLQKGAIVIVLMTRWHEDDLVGRLLANDREVAEEDREGWRVLNIPAVWEPDPDLGETDDPLGRQEGDALCPQLGFDKRWARRKKAAVGNYWWSAMYQGRPRPAEGMLFKRKDFRYFTVETLDTGDVMYVMEDEDGSMHPVAANECVHFQTADTAASEDEMADYTAVGTWAVTPNRDLLLLTVERERFEDIRVGSYLTRCYNTANGDVTGGVAFVTVENASSGPKAIKELGIAGLPVRGADPDKDKVTRALLAVARYETHCVYHLHGAEWRRDFEDELLAFPNATHDDQVDMLSYAAIELPRIQLARGPGRKDRPKTHTAGIRTKRL